MKKNVANQVIGVQMITAADGTAFTGSVSVAVTGDGGTQGAGGGTGPTHEGNGFYTYVPTQAETNYDHIGFTFTGTGAIPATVQVYTTFPQTGDSFARLGAPAGASVSADIATVDANVDAILVDTGTDIPASFAAVPAAVWDRVLTGATHNIANSAGRRLRTLAPALGGAVTGTPTSTVFTTDLAGYANDHFNDQVIRFTSGSAADQVAIISDFVGATGQITVDEPIVGTLNATDTFEIIPTHVHPKNQIADAILNRDMSAVSDTNARSPLNALRFLRNKWSVSGTTLTVTKEDDTTSAWTSTVTTNASAEPVTGSDPA